MKIRVLRGGNAEILDDAGNDLIGKLCATQIDIHVCAKSGRPTATITAYPTEVFIEDAEGVVRWTCHRCGKETVTSTAVIPACPCGAALAVRPCSSCEPVTEKV